MGQIFIVATTDKWSLFTRTVPTMTMTKAQTSISGSDFVGYRAGPYTIKSYPNGNRWTMNERCSWAQV
ncbi:MAG: hypothetical protein PHH83_04895 [Patescibacteria group bacterium]|nr:hypothetical protein [Patescibacteria group bacterium]